MIRLGLLLLTLSSSALVAQDAEPFPPEAYLADRYNTMKARSPFVLPSFAEEVAPPVAADWTSDFRIVSVLQLGSDSMVLAKKLSTDERIPIRPSRNSLVTKLQGCNGNC